jgi:omega-6 fatty acid desaturase (delta-12 desaturase)
MESESTSDGMRAASERSCPAPDASAVPDADRAGLALCAELMRYRTPTVSRAVGELAITLIPFVLVWYAMYRAVVGGYGWAYALLLPFAAGFMVRLFLIQHDCGHRAFLPATAANDWLGRCLGVLTLTAYAHWKRAHAIHHATSGNLDRRGVGDIDTLTVAEYNARTPLLRWRYRLYRNPLLLFGIGPLFVFVLQNRIPAGFFRAGWRPWASTLGTDLFIGLLAAAVIYRIGWAPFLLVHFPITLLSASIGGWLFYVQHQFEHTSWSRARTWRSREAALKGSSYYDLPRILRWFTANIGMHHVHHLCSRIPFYRLPLALASHREIRETERLTLRQSFRCVSLALWDEESQRLVSFRAAARIRASA